MPDDFRYWRLKDMERAIDVIRSILAWGFDLRHSSTEALENEETRTRELSAKLLDFNNSRLAAPGQPGQRWVTDPTLPFDLKRVETRDWSFIQKALKAAIPHLDNGVNYWRLDGKYYMVNQDEMAKIIFWSWVDQKQYVAERYDCEDFAFAFKAEVSRIFELNQVGLVIDWSGGHGYNVIVFPDSTVWFFEPQKDELVDIGHGIYKMERAEILI